MDKALRIKGSIVTAIAWGALSLSALAAQDLLAVPGAPVPGSPGTATPNPYPPVVPSTVPMTQGSSGSVVPLAPINLPQPPTDQPLPGLQQAPPKKPGNGS